MLIYSLLLYSVLIVAYGTCLLVLYVSNQKMVQNQVLHYENPTAWLVLLVFLIFMSFLVMILAGRLVILHIWLRRKKLSMFEYYLISKKAKLAKVTPNNTSIGYENDLSIGEIKPEVSMNIKKLI